MLQLVPSPDLKRLKSIGPENLVGDKVQPGHRLFGLVWINPDRLSGVPCFFGTRVTVQTLFDCLAAGQSMDEFLDDFEGVEREQALAVLRLAGANFMAELKSI